MTKYLLNNRLAPLTFSWGFVEEPLPAVTEFVKNWNQRNFPQLRTESVHAPFHEALRKLEPLVEPRAQLLLSTESEWTAYFGNHRRGDTCGFAVSYICKEMGCRGIAVSCIPDTIVKVEKGTKGVNGSTAFLLIAPEKREFLNFERGISVTDDCGSWDFRSTGPPQPFEQVSRYSASRIIDRLTPEMVEQYCATFGIRLFDPEFYGPSGALFKLFHPRPKFLPLSLEQVQRDMGPLPS
jgi:hypothetical protein